MDFNAFIFVIRNLLFLDLSTYFSHVSIRIHFGHKKQAITISKLASLILLDRYSDDTSIQISYEHFMKNGHIGFVNICIGIEL
jgi:hypothetical protein